MNYTCKALDDNKLTKLLILLFSLFPTGFLIYSIYGLFARLISPLTFIIVLVITVPIMAYALYLFTYKILLTDTSIIVLYFFKERKHLNLEQMHNDVILYRHGRIFFGFKVKYHNYNKVKINGGYKYQYSNDMKINHVSDQLVSLLKEKGYKI